jgi:hypothetical protein
MPERKTAIDLDGTERTLSQIAARYGITYRAVVFRLVASGDGPPRLRPTMKPGPKGKQEQASK